MKRWAKYVSIGLLTLIAVAGGAFYWLFFDNRIPSSGSYVFDIAAVRAAASAMPGERAQLVEVETVSHSSVPRIAMVAGTDWVKIDIPRNVYRLVFPDRTMIIDTAWDANTARAAKVDRFDTAAYDRVATAMNAASMIIVTHEHPDHIGGLLSSPNWQALLPKALITSEQFNHPKYTRPLEWPAGSRESFKPLDYTGYRAVAPGVVLIKAPGHTPGSQIIYVQRADGQEYLFVGDVASQADNIKLQRGRSRLVDDFMVGSDHGAVLLQLVALHRLSLNEPRIAMVPGHDGAAIARFEAQNLMRRGFQ